MKVPRPPRKPSLARRCGRGIPSRGASSFFLLAFYIPMVYNGAAGIFGRKEGRYMGDWTSGGRGEQTPAEKVLDTRVPSKIKTFLDAHQLTDRVAVLADEDIEHFPGLNRESIICSRTKATIASVLHEEADKLQPGSAKEEFVAMFELVCQDMVHDMQDEEIRALKARER